MLIDKEKVLNIVNKRIQSTQTLITKYNKEKKLDDFWGVVLKGLKWRKDYLTDIFIEISLLKE